MKKRIVSLLLALCLCAALLPTVALAAEGDYEITVCNTKITDSNKNNVLSDGTVSYDSSTHTLTLNGATLTGSISVSDLNSGTLTIHLIGTNTITVPATQNAGIDAGSGGNLQFTGASGGSLTIDFINEGSSRTEAYGIKLGGQGKLIIASGATVTATGGTATKESCGIYCKNWFLTVAAGAHLTATGGAVNTNGDANSYGVKVGGDLTVNGTLTAIGGNAASTGQYNSASSYGVYTKGNATVNGTLTATSGVASAFETSQSVGVFLEKGLTVYGELTGDAGSAQGRQGILCTNTLTVQGETAKLTATYHDPENSGSNNATQSNGIETTQLIVRDGASVTADAAPAELASFGIGLTPAPSISQPNQLLARIEGEETTVCATGSEVTGDNGQSCGLRALSNGGQSRVEILGGTVAFSGKTLGVRVETLQIGSDTERVDFTATAAADEMKNPNGAVFLYNFSNEKAGTLTLTNGQIVEPAGGKLKEISDFPITEQTESRTPDVIVVVDETDEIAMQVHICATAKEDDDTLPGWLASVLGAPDREPFDDVTTRDWFYDDVSYVNEYGLMTGTGYRTFSPNAPVTRGMVMTILARREGIRTDRYSPWYAAGVDWAVANGISDGTNPEAAITREELATMLYRYASLKGYDLSGAALTGFTDASGVSSYAVPAMQWAVDAGLISGAAGVDAGKLLPAATATRAQLAAILHRFFG